MCRLLAYSGSIDDANGVLREFRRLAEEGNAPPGEAPGHKDGWGIMCYADGILKELGRRPEDALTDGLYVSASNEAARIRPKILIAHLRKASPGIGISLENTQPLRNGSWSFAHNGTIWSPNFRRSNGQSDSIVLFEKLLEKIQRKSGSDTMDQRLSQAVLQLRNVILQNPDSEGRTYTSITFILSDGNSLWVIRDYRDDHDEEYYTMHYMISTDCILFCQQQIIPGNWKSLGNKSMAIVDPENNLDIVQYH
jgi:predicted glutamine amidotransferase